MFWQRHVCYLFIQRIEIWPRALINCSSTTWNSKRPIWPITIWTWSSNWKSSNFALWIKNWTDGNVTNNCQAMVPLLPTIWTRSKSGVKIWPKSSGSTCSKSGSWKWSRNNSTFQVMNWPWISCPSLGKVKKRREIWICEAAWATLKLLSVKAKVKVNFFNYGSFFQSTLSAWFSLFDAHKDALKKPVTPTNWEPQVESFRLSIEKHFNVKQLHFSLLMIFFLVMDSPCYLTTWSRAHLS